MANLYFKLILLLMWFAHYSNVAAAQWRAPWIRFGQEEAGLYGFRDSTGAIRIPAGPFLYQADTFHHIMAVADTNMRSWYLLKNGLIVGRDSVHYFDATPDCESEGLIRFRDPKRDQVGFFDSEGRVVIPAMYDYAGPFVNGLSVAHRNGRKQCADADTANCEHWTWAGGEEILINAANEVLVRDLSQTDLNLDWFTMQKNAPGYDLQHWVTLAGTDGNSYSFRHLQRDPGWRTISGAH